MEPLPTEDEPAAIPSGRVAFERLRERTDELELIVSGLITFVLLSMPQWLIEWYAGSFVHLSGVAAHLGLMGAALSIGICLTLGGSFLLHLLVRAYWVGLIGLKSVFPHGIRWDRVPGTGPIGRQQMRERLPDLQAAIDAADRFASGLFALISLATIVLLWAVFVQVVVAVAAALLGLLAGGFDRAMLIVLGTVLAVILGVSALVYLLDAVLAARSARWREDPRLVAVVRRMRAFMGALLPERLIIPVQLTLATNTRPRGFMVVLMFGTLLVPLFGLGYVANYRNFASIGDYRHLPADELHGGIGSVHYESLRTPHDRLRPLPMIASDQIATPFVRVFIPYHPRRDDPRLERLCAAAVEPAVHGSACLRRLWQVELDGRPVSLDAFEPAQRNDLGLRGLQGYLPLVDATPGMHLLLLRKQSAPAAATGAEDADDAGDAESSRRDQYRIPFLYAPEAR